MEFGPLERKDAQAVFPDIFEALAEAGVDDVAWPILAGVPSRILRLQVCCVRSLAVCCVRCALCFSAPPRKLHF